MSQKFREGPLKDSKNFTNNPFPKEHPFHSFWTEAYLTGLRDGLKESLVLMEKVRIAQILLKFKTEDEMKNVQKRTAKEILMLGKEKKRNNH